MADKNNIEKLQTRMAKVKNALAFIRGETDSLDDKSAPVIKDKGDRIQWLLDRGYI